MCRLLNPQLEKTFEAFPLYSQDGKGREAMCIAVFKLGNARWYILEGDKEDDDVIMFAIVIGLIADEYGYVSLKELSDVVLDLSSQGYGKLQVSQLIDYIKPIALKDIQDKRLQDFLARFED